MSAALLPYLSAAGTLYQGIQANQAARYNATVATQEQANAVNSASAQAGLVRRAGREALGRQAAAFGAAGVGYGGSSEGALDQSAVNSELDALTTQYRGAITGWGYGAQAQLDQQMGKQNLVGSGLLAGAALLKGMGPTYSFAPKVVGLGSQTPASGLGGNINTAGGSPFFGPGGP